MVGLYPLLFQPVLKDYVWGGRRLETTLGRALPPGITAESWEIASHTNGSSLVINGHFAGMDLTELYEKLGPQLVGSNSASGIQPGKFPLLVKLLDARERLSVQVHPQDEYASLHEKGELGKSEMWVILHADPGASIILGLKQDTDSDTLKKAALKGTLDEYLHQVAVSAGDFVCVPSGSLHAILGGLVLAEIQQNSDVTYRVYDWGRTNVNRALHLRQALDVINFEQVEPDLESALPLPSAEGQTREELCSNKFFTVERWHLSQGQHYEGRCDGSTFEIWGIIDGAVDIMWDKERVRLEAVRFTLLPAALGSFGLKANSKSTLLRVYSNP